MTFRPDAIDTFLDLFDAAAPQIRSFPGCRHLELWQDVNFPNVLTTYSLWESSDDLEAYRLSDFFRSTWSRTRPLFAAPPRAFSQAVLRSAQ